MKRGTLALESGKAKLAQTMPASIERCQNPWAGKCEKTDIAIYIFHGGTRVPICKKCWGSISATDVEWM